MLGGGRGGRGEETLQLGVLPLQNKSLVSKASCFD